MDTNQSLPCTQRRSGTRRDVEVTLHPLGIPAEGTAQLSREERFRRLLRIGKSSPCQTRRGASGATVCNTKANASAKARATSTYHVSNDQGCQPICTQYANSGAICRTVQLLHQPCSVQSSAIFSNCSAVPPFVVVVLDGSHSVPPQLDFDWTLHNDRKLELQRREQRDQRVKDALQRGKTVRTRSSGNSLDPWVLSNGSSNDVLDVGVSASLSLGRIASCFLSCQPGCDCSFAVALACVPLSLIHI